MTANIFLRMASTYGICMKSLFKQGCSYLMRVNFGMSRLLCLGEAKDLVRLQRS